jgi:hypothetical protein
MKNYFEVLSQHLDGKTEENKEIPQDSPTKYKSQELVIT